MVIHNLGLNIFWIVLVFLIQSKFRKPSFLCMAASVHIDLVILASTHQVVRTEHAGNAAAC